MEKLFATQISPLTKQGNSESDLDILVGSNIMRSQSKTVAYGFCSVQYLTQGLGYPIVLLPSLGRGPADFDRLADLLVVAGLKVIRPFPRGMGQSYGTTHDLTLHDLAEDVAAVIEQEGEPDAIVTGHALGNFIARTVATDFPLLVRGVALLAASAGKAPEGQSTIPSDILDSVYQSGEVSLPDSLRLQHLQKAFFAPGNDPAIWLDGWYPAVKAIQNAAWRATPVDDYFSAGTAPLLDVQALQDTVAPRTFSHVLKEALGDRVTVAHVDRAGHALIPEQPGAVAMALGDWVTKLLSAPGVPASNSRRA
ncbi:alpha/beta fold hydrolase [Cupriavidus basilensis]|uniref:alpha/beta fold hydrolase n=1 Tax=Cupriavidus basilensis TaxID=68895 RepID=UPI0023E82333|nr:alpha/beta hydrolase [Cupriavidus basilensis]MDF3883021.1 alpha/beta hydrolase [Cupriavidus basilensis]